MPSDRQELDERRVLALRDVEVDRMEEAVGGILERPPERGPGRLDQRLPKRRGHALAAESPRSAPAS